MIDGAILRTVAGRTGVKPRALRPAVLRMISALGAMALAVSARADDVRFPAAPEPPSFVNDGAGMLAEADIETIDAQAGRLFDELHIPIIVVTVPTMGDFGAGDLSIERYARRLFDHLEIGRANWNYGILLFIAEADRKARIELGAEWPRDADPTCRRIMDDLIVASFKDGQFARGIRLGVDGLNAMCRGAELPEPVRAQSPGAASAGGEGNLRQGLFKWFSYLGEGTFFVIVLALGIGLRFLHHIVWFVVWTVTLGRVNLHIPEIPLGRRFYRRGYGGFGGFGGGGGGGGGGGFSGGGGASGSW